MEIIAPEDFRKLPEDLEWFCAVEDAPTEDRLEGFSLEGSTFYNLSGTRSTLKLQKELLYEGTAAAMRRDVGEIYQRVECAVVRERLGLAPRCHVWFGQEEL